MGSLSGQLAALPIDQQEAVIRIVTQLPPSIAIVPLRDLVPLMAEVSLRHNLNIIDLEILAATISCDAEIIVADGNVSPLLEAAAKAEGIPFSAIALS